MSYLARLKRLDSDKNFTHPPDTELTKPTQPGSVSFDGTVLAHIEKTKGGSVSFVSSVPAHIEKITAANDGERIDTESTLTAVESIATAMDDRRRCSQCLNLRQWVCTIAKPECGALVVANRGYLPVPDTPQRCAGYLPNVTDNDQRPSCERWPGL